jgi:hypothetical protein
MGNLVDLGGLEIPINFDVTGFTMPDFGNIQNSAGFQNALAGAEFGAAGVTIINNYLPPGVSPTELQDSQSEQNTRRGPSTYEVAGAGVL